MTTPPAGSAEVASHFAHIHRVVTAYGMTAQHAESLSVVREGIAALTAQVEALARERDAFRQSRDEWKHRYGQMDDTRIEAEQRAASLQAELDAAKVMPARKPDYVSDEGDDYPSTSSYQEGSIEGWNACLDAIDAARAKERT